MSLQNSSRVVRNVRSTAFVAAVAAALLPAAAMAQTSTADFCLVAERYVSTTNVAMWGYRLCTTPTGSATSPGPVLNVPATRTSFKVELRNILTYGDGSAGPNTSLVINGLTPATPPAPVETWVITDREVVADGGVGKAINTRDTGVPCSAGQTPPAIDQSCRVRSFNTEAVAGGAGVVYTFNTSSDRAGTFLYQSGTVPQRQVQMGLIGALKQDFGSRIAYPGVAYERDHVLVYSEVDPDVHARIDTQTFTGSTLNYKPTQFLINGQSFVDEAGAGDGLPVPVRLVRPLGNPGERVMLRLLNGGLRTRSPSLSDGTVQLIATSGFQKKVGTAAVVAGAVQKTTTPVAPATTVLPQEVSSVLLPASDTADLLYAIPATAIAGPRFALFDRRNGQPQDSTTGAASGMLVKFSGGTAPALGVRFASTPPAVRPPLAPGALYSYSPTVTGNVGAVTYSLAATPVPPSGMQIVNGVLNWTPPAGTFGTFSATLSATDTLPSTDTQSVSVAVSMPPVAVNDAYTVNIGSLAIALPTAATTYTLPLGSTRATGVLNNDTDVDTAAGDVVSVDAATGGFTQPAAGGGTVALSSASNGLFTLNVPATFVGTAASRATSFTYRAIDSLGAVSSSFATATVTVNANQAPVAVADGSAAAPLSVSRVTVLNQGNATALQVLANDTDPDSTSTIQSTALLNPASVQLIGTVLVNGGAVDTCGNGSFAGTNSPRVAVTPNANGTVSVRVWQRTGLLGIVVCNTPAPANAIITFQYRVADYLGAYSAPVTVTARAP